MILPPMIPIFRKIVYMSYVCLNLSIYLSIYGCMWEDIVDAL